MRIVAVSDIHGDTRAKKFLGEVTKAHSPDLLIICGDITTFGPASVAEQILSGLETKCAAVPGNCDPDEVLKVIEKHCISLHGKRVKIGSVEFAGIGGSPICTMSTPREIDEAAIDKILSKIMVPDCVLVTHAPPTDTNDITRSGKSLGSKSIRKNIQKFRPRLVLSGHVHEAKGIIEKGGIIYANPGPLKEGFVILAELNGKMTIELIDMSDKLKNL